MANIWPKMTENANFWPNLAVFGQKILMIREAAIILVASYQGLDTSFVLKILTGDAPMQWAARYENVQFGSVQLVPKMKQKSNIYFGHF